MQEAGYEIKTGKYIPALSCAISSEEIFSSSIRTGIRCCTFTKFPAELSVGTKEYFDPVASEIAATSPLKIFPVRIELENISSEEMAQLRAGMMVETEALRK